RSGRTPHRSAHHRRVPACRGTQATARPRRAPDPRQLFRPLQPAPDPAGPPYTEPRPLVKGRRNNAWIVGVARSGARGPVTNRIGPPGKNPTPIPDRPASPPHRGAPVPQTLS